jgi:GntR family transcriptional repressor for pyruvate dehydrogenase complex
VTAPAAPPPPAAPIALTRMRVPKASDLLAHELRERILSGDFAEGAGLPAERELVTQTGLSRTTIREALRILEVQGLVRIRAGRSGGAFVQRPGEEAMANTVEHIIRGQKIALPALLITRQALEPYCAELAAQNRTTAQLAVLESATTLSLEGGHPLDRVLEANAEWHVAVARASGNELLSGLMIALTHGAYDEHIVDEELERSGAAEHAAITEAIGRQDTATAGLLMQRHVAAFS